MQCLLHIFFIPVGVKFNNSSDVNKIYQKLFFKSYFYKTICFLSFRRESFFCLQHFSRWRYFGILWFTLRYEYSCLPNPWLYWSWLYLYWIRAVLPIISANSLGTRYVNMVIFPFTFIMIEKAYVYHIRVFTGQLSRFKLCLWYKMLT